VFGFIRRQFYLGTLGDQAYRCLYAPGPAGEVVALDCETTGLNPRVDEVVAVAAVRIQGNRILLSERYEAVVRPETMPAVAAIKVHRLRERDLEHGRPIREVLPELLRFIAGRPIVGYYIDFDIRMLDKHILRQIETKLPNPQIEISRLYYDRKYGNAPPGTVLDLSFAAILADLGIPPLEQHDALNDALMSAMMSLQLRDLQARGIRIPRPRSSNRDTPPTGG
jgi:DNA polymerase-3 subunit epsilon